MRCCNERGLEKATKSRVKAKIEWKIGYLVSLDERAERDAGDILSLITQYFEAIGSSGNSINLGIGDLDHDLFDVLKEEAVRRITSGYNKYTQTAGIPDLREEVAKYYQRRWKCEITSKNVIITPGASNALFMSIASVLRGGGEVVIPTPTFPSFSALTLIMGGRVYEVPTRMEEGFKPRAETIASKLGEKTCAVIINSPSNPTGSIYDEDLIGALVDECKRRGVYIISDEVYERFDYTGRYTSLAKFWDSYDKIIIVNSFSKTLAMTGWRLGYMVIPEHLYSRVMRLQAFINACPPSVAQYVALFALRSPEVERLIDAKVAEYRDRRDGMWRELSEAGVQVLLPEGGIFLFPKIPLEMDSEAFCNRLAKSKGVITIPGRAFGAGGERHFRITISAPINTLTEAARRIASFIEECRASK